MYNISVLTFYYYQCVLTFVKTTPMLLEHSSSVSVYPEKPLGFKEHLSQNKHKRLARQNLDRKCIRMNGKRTNSSKNIFAINF